MTYYFILLLRNGTQLIFTQMLSTHDPMMRGSLDFPNLIKISNISGSFQLQLDIYCMVRTVFMRSARVSLSLSQTWCTVHLCHCLCHRHGVQCTCVIVLCHKHGVQCTCVIVLCHRHGVQWTCVIVFCHRHGVQCTCGIVLCHKHGVQCTCGIVFCHKHDIIGAWVGSKLVLFLKRQHFTSI